MEKNLQKFKNIHRRELRAKLLSLAKARCWSGGIGDFDIGVVDAVRENDKEEIGDRSGWLQIGVGPWVGGFQVGVGGFNSGGWLQILSLHLHFFFFFFFFSLSLFLSFFLRFCCFCILGLVSMNDCNYFWLINQVLETQFSSRRHVEKKKKAKSM